MWVQVPPVLPFPFQEIDLRALSMNGEATCSVEDCDYPAKTKGMCHAHYCRSRSGRNWSGSIVRRGLRKGILEPWIERSMLQAYGSSTEKCFEWPHGGNRDGYGVVYVQGKSVLVTRFMAELCLGRRLSSKECVCHQCDNPPCCNPWHLFVGTQKDNLADARQKGRLSFHKGEDNFSSKVNKRDVLQIRRRRNNGETYSSLGRRFNLSVNGVKKICLRKTWAHVA